MGKKEREGRREGQRGTPVARSEHCRKQSHSSCQVH